MDLHMAAAYFDDTPVLDASGALLFLAQLDLYDDSKRDGVGVDRRLLAMQPEYEVQLPASRQLLVAGQDWIAGEVQRDSFQGEIIRCKAILQRADVSVVWGTPAQILDASGLTTSLAGMVWTKEAKYEAVTSGVRAFYTLYVAEDFPGLQPGHYATVRGTLCRVRSRYLTAGGFGAVEVIETSPNSLRSVDYGSRVFDGAAGSYATTSLPNTPALVLEYFEDYTVRQADVDFEKADKQVLVTKTAVPAPKTGDTLSGVGTVAGVADAGDCWQLRVCP